MAMPVTRNHPLSGLIPPVTNHCESAECETNPDGPRPPPSFIFRRTHRHASAATVGPSASDVLRHSNNDMLSVRAGRLPWCRGLDAELNHDTIRPDFMPLEAGER